MQSCASLLGRHTGTVSIIINVRRKEIYCYRIGLEIKCPEKCQIEMDNYGGDALDLSKMNDALERSNIT